MLGRRQRRTPPPVSSNPLDRFDHEVLHAVRVAQEIARQHDHPRVGADHLLIALTAAPVTDAVRRVLEAAGFDPEEVRQVAAEELVAGPGAGQHGLPLDEGAQAAVETAYREQLRHGHDWIGTGHLVLGALAGCGVEVDAARVAPVLAGLSRPAPDPGRQP